MADKQTQKSGDNAQQFLADTVIIAGIDEKRVREIFAEMFVIERRNLTAEAGIVADIRVTEFENRLLPKMIAADALKAFGDPGFQILLRKAQLAAAATERPNDYELLSELLIYRFQKGDNRNTRAGITRAVEIIDQINDDALLGLTVFHSVCYFFPKTNDIFQGLDVLNDLFGKIIYDVLPTGNEWIDYLDVLDAIRITPFGKLKKFIEYYPLRLENYISPGIDKSSDNYNKANEILTKVGFSQETLIPHALNPYYVRLNITKREIENSSFFVNLPQNGQIIQKQYPTTKEQKEALYSIFDLYNNDDNIKNDNITKLMEEIKKRQYLKSVKDWWDNVDANFDTTSVGKVLAHTNAQRINKNLPPLN
jgi:hypothetical protein